MKVDIRAAVEGIAAISVVLSLIFVGIELRLSRDVAETDNLNTLLANGIELRSLITDHAEVWQRACVGEELSAAEALLANQIMAAYSQYAYIRFRNSQGNISNLPSIQVTLDVALNMHRYPGFRERWKLIEEETAAGHPLRMAERANQPGYLDEIERLYEYLEDTDPNPNRDLALCGY